MSAPTVRLAVGVAVAGLLALPRSAGAKPAISDHPLAAPALDTFPLAVHLSGYVQADGVTYDRSSQDEVDSSTGSPLNQTRYLIRRARLHLDIDHGALGGSVEFDGNTVNGASVGLIDAEVTLRPMATQASARPWGDLSIGLLRTPWGCEISERDQDRFFLERSQVSRALFPGVFDLGVRARLEWRFLDVRIALMNGNPLADRTFAGQDPNRAKDLVGRVGISGVRRRVVFMAGMSALSGTGFHRGTPETKDVLVWRDENEDGIVQLSEIQVISGTAATSSRNFRRFALGADVRITVTVPRLGFLDLFAEGIWAANLDRGLERADPVAAGRDLREHGWVAGFVQQVGAHVTLGARFDHYNSDVDAFAERAIHVVPVDAAFTTWTATAAWRWAALDRISLEGQHGTNALGRTPTGSPTTLGGDSVSLRGQLAW